MKRRDPPRGEQGRGGAKGPAPGVRKTKNKLRGEPSRRAGETAGFPPAIAAVLGASAGIRENTGRSSAQVWVYPDHVLKIRPAGGPDTADTEILRWLRGRLPVPAVAAHVIRDGTDWLLMTRIGGRMLCDPAVMDRPALLMDCIAEALYMLWSADTAGCPFDRTLEGELDAAERAIRAGTYDPSGCDPETFGPGGFRDPMALLDWLRGNMPPGERTLTHGDFCLPNVLTDGRGVSGMIDLGGCGIADPWRDLAMGWWSLKHNSNGHFGIRRPQIDPDDLFRAAGIRKDADKLKYYLLLKELL